MNQSDVLKPFYQAFQKNREVRPCSYDASLNIERVNETYLDKMDNTWKTKEKLILALPYKLLWFQTYCAENNLNGYIDSDYSEIVTDDKNGTGMVMAKAKVVINGETVATASASAGFSFTSTDVSRDVAVQTATGGALSRALGYAGFGTISSFEVPPKYTGQNAPVTNAGSGELPFTGPNEVPPAATQNTPTAFTPANTLPPASGNVPGASEQASLFAPPPPPANEDPITAAKSVIYPCNGHYKGKPLGELLATSPRQIIWVAETWKPKTSNDIAVQEAAKLLLPEAKVRCGK